MAYSPYRITIDTETKNKIIAHHAGTAMLPPLYSYGTATIVIDGRSWAITADDLKGRKVYGLFDIYKEHNYRMAKKHPEIYGWYVYDSFLKAIMESKINTKRKRKMIAELSKLTDSRRKNETAGQ